MACSMCVIAPFAEGQACSMSRATSATVADSPWRL
jgi:hypothetical protein